MLSYKAKSVRNIIRLTKWRFSTSTFNANKDYYKILGLQKTASDSQIKLAYYKLAKKYHPDHNKGSQAQFKQINEAYTILSDSASKRQYQNARNSSAQSSNANSYTQNYGQYQSYNQNYSQYSQYQRQYYQDPYQAYRDQNQRQYYYGYKQQSYNPYSQDYNNNQYYQWQGGQQQSQRNFYQNPYEAYNRFRQQQENLRRQRARQYQQYQQYEEYMRKTNDQPLTKEELQSAKNFVKIALGIALLFTLLMMNQPRNKYFYDVSTHPQAYRMANISSQEAFAYGNQYSQRS